MVAGLVAGLAAVALVGLAAGLAVLSTRVRAEEAEGGRHADAWRAGPARSDGANAYWMWSGAGDTGGNPGDGGTVGTGSGGGDFGTGFGGSDSGGFGGGFGGFDGGEGGGGFRRPAPRRTGPTLP